jgi:pimeloyl-ACP methyl ester carboxylesterase
VTSTRLRPVGAVLAFVALAACTPDPPVAVERSDASVGQPSADDGSPDIGAEREPSPESTEPEPAPPRVSSLEWGGCAPFGIPQPDVLGTAGWECASLIVPMDPLGGEVDETVNLALTRHSATGTRLGAILVNPGGPGGDGLTSVWSIRNELPAAMLRGFDIVSWDPRGIGKSTPAIDCDDEVSPSDRNFIARCVEMTGTLSGYLSVPYVAADMEAIRAALGEERLNFLGYSYGSIVGATYAAAHPERVGAMVLDGATDPLVGTSQGPSSGGFPSLADDGFDSALERFSEICDATDECLFSLDAADIVDDLRDQVAALPTLDFARPPDQVDVFDYDEFIENTLIFAGEWELAGTALSDADLGDASAIASLVAGPDPTESGEDQVGETAFSEANFMIYCADLKEQLAGQTFCDDMPTNTERLEPVATVALERDLLVIGTEYDPLTPGYHAVDFAAALGAASHIVWEGVGHTAFPGWTPCIDDAVADYFAGEPAPPDGMRCSFLLGIDDDTALGDELFGQGDLESETYLENRLTADDSLDDDEITCIARAVNDESNQVISHVILDVTSDQAQAALSDAAASC